jgi:MOSC domain-containing protein YiiM
MILRRIFISPGHNFVGRHGLSPENHAMLDIERVECVAGRGLRGDRYFDHRPDFKGQVTLFSAEVFFALCAARSAPELKPSALRRNLIVEKADLNALVGREFLLQGIRLFGTEQCRPCYWMDQAIGPGAEAWLQGRGGLRCRILTDGWLLREVSAATMAHLP